MHLQTCMQHHFPPNTSRWLPTISVWRRHAALYAWYPCMVPVHGGSGWLCYSLHTHMPLHQYMPPHCYGGGCHMHAPIGAPRLRWRRGPCQQIHNQTKLMPGPPYASSDCGGGGLTRIWLCVHKHEHPYTAHVHTRAHIHVHAQIAVAEACYANDFVSTLSQVGMREMIEENKK